MVQAGAGNINRGRTEEKVTKKGIGERSLDGTGERSIVRTREDQLM